MLYATIYPDDTLETLSQRLGPNINQILADNGLKRTPNIGQQWENWVNQNTASSAWSDNDKGRASQAYILSKFVADSDIYEAALGADDNDWKMLVSQNTFSDKLYISDAIQDSVVETYDVIGNHKSVDLLLHQTVIGRLTDPIHSEPLSNIYLDFESTFSTTRAAPSIPGVSVLDVNSRGVQSVSPISWFNVPQGEVTLYSSLAGTSLDIPAYPEEVSDGHVATYTQMPDLLYQYEPWQMYQSSGPRTNTYEFHLHRDMWSGNHNDGKANELIRFCQAQCYANYNGASVISPTVTLYISGSPVISGIMNQVDVKWGGPLGHDGWYLDFTLSLTITEISRSALNHDAMIAKPLIG